MFVVLGQKAEGDGGHWIMAPGAVEAAEQSTAFLQNRGKGQLRY